MRLVFVMVVLGGCPKQDEPSAARTDPAPVASPTPAEAQRDAALDAASPALPQPIGPPAPYDQLRPKMQRADVQAALSDAGVQVATVPDKLAAPGITMYASPLPDTYVYLGFADGRLDSIVFTTQNVPSLEMPAVAGWGAGTESKVSYQRTIAWPPSSTGWTASLELPEGAYRVFEPKLILRATREAGTGVTAAADPRLVGKLVAAVGAPLDTVAKTFPSLERETADDDGGAERGTRKQGFARVEVAWSKDAWQVVFRTDANERVTAVELAGSTDAEAGRIALLDALRAELGAAKPVISRAGRLEIELASKKAVARVSEHDTNQWTISLGR